MSRSLIYVKGNIPGTPGSVVELKDSVKKYDQNQQYINYPTFIPQENIVKLT